MKNIRVVTGDDTMSDTDEVILYDTNADGGTITMPVCADGKELVFSPKNLGGPGSASYVLAPNGSDSFDPTVGAYLIPYSETRMIGKDGVWYLG